MLSVNINKLVVCIAKCGIDTTEGRRLHSIFISRKSKIYFIMLDSSIQFHNAQPSWILSSKLANFHAFVGVARR